MLQGVTEVALEPAVLRTELIFLLLDEPPGLAPTRYTVSPLAARVLRKRRQ